MKLTLKNSGTGKLENMTLVPLPKSQFLGFITNVGLGLALILGGGGIPYLANQLKKKFRAQENQIDELRNEIRELKAEVEQLKTIVQSTNFIWPTPHINKVRLDNKSCVDDDEYLTADEEDEDISGEQDSSHAFFTDLDTLLDGSTEEQRQGYRILKKFETGKQFQNSCEFWWRFAKGSHFEATALNSEGNKSRFQELITQGFTFAEKAVELNEDSANAHKWLAILCGSRSEFLGINDRIQGGYKFKQHVDRAISLDPTDPTCYYLLGRFCFEVSTLSWFERQVASTLFSTPPSSSPEEAMTYFQKSESLKPFMDNRYYMAKCYYVLQNKPEALKWLNLAASMPVTTTTDTACLENVMTFRQKLLSS